MNAITTRQNIAISNKMIKGRYQLTNEEQNFIYLMVSQINKDDVDFQEYSINISQISELVGADKNYTRYKEFAKNLRSKVIVIEDEIRILTSGWFNSIEYIKDSGTIHACFDPKLKPYLLELKKEFTKAKLPILLSFGSKYSSRLYLLFKSEYDRQSKHKEIVTINYTLEYFYKNFELPPSYQSSYMGFKNKFLEKSIKEINAKTDLVISYKPRKTSRKITSLDITIQNKQNEQEDHLPSRIEQVMQYSVQSRDVLLSTELALTQQDLHYLNLMLKDEEVEEICQDIANKWQVINNKQAYYRKKVKAKSIY